ncbi:MAG: PAS domain S-box protein, partial [Acidobacteria bacterium]|nr:PAS domain S-box protein [Acidobacteriota bacterium]
MVKKLPKKEKGPLGRHDPVHVSEAPYKAPAAADDSTYRSFIENLPVMFYAVEAHPPHTPIYISPTFESFGYPLQSWFSDPDIWDRVMHPDDREKVLGETRSAMKRGEGIDFEYRVVCKDGTVRWVRDRSCFIKGRDGELLCWQGVILDITDQKTAEQELEKREKLYRTLARTIPKTAVLLFDHDFRYTLADGEQLARHGWSQDMFEDKTLWEVFPEDVSAEWEGYYKRALNGETVVIDMDNEEGSYQVNVLPIKDETGHVFAGMVIWQDISERKLAENALKESEARYRQLFENANDIIYVHDLYGNYISINQAAERIFGYSHEEALSLNMADITAPEHMDLVRQM